jgi:hypothetical protein
MINYKISWISCSFIFTAIIVFISDWIQNIGILYFPPGFRYLIILIVFLVNRIAFGQNSLLQKAYKISIISILIILFIEFFFSPAPLLNYILGIGFTFLFVIIFNLGASTKSSSLVIIKIFKNLLIFFFFMSIIPVIQAVTTVVSLREIPVFFRELGAFGSAMNIGTLISISLYLITTKKRYLYLAVFFSFVVFMTILKKSIISNMIVWFAFFLIQTNSKIRFKILIYSLIIIAITFITLGNNLIENYNENLIYLEDSGVEGHVRLGMYLASFRIATDFFPFGSGMGTFASLASITGGYSNIYYDYGVANIGYNAPEHVIAGTTTILDTWWPHILGELGFIGILLFLYLWIYPIRIALITYKNTNDQFKKGISFYIILILIIMIWEGFSLSTPENPGFIILHAGLSGLCFHHIVNNLTTLKKLR